MGMKGQQGKKGQTLSGPLIERDHIFLTPKSDLVYGAGKSRLTLVCEIEFILILLFINYCIIFIRTTVKLLLPHPV